MHTVDSMVESIYLSIEYRRKSWEDKREQMFLGSSQKSKSNLFIFHISYKSCSMWKTKIENIILTIKCIFHVKATKKKNIFQPDLK